MTIRQQLLTFISRDMFIQHPRGSSEPSVAAAITAPPENLTLRTDVPVTLGLQTETSYL